MRKEHDDWFLTITILEFDHLTNYHSAQPKRWRERLGVYRKNRCRQRTEEHTVRRYVCESIGCMFSCCMFSCDHSAATAGPGR